MWPLVSRVLLIFHFSLIFSLALLCTILWARARDTNIRGFLLVLYPLFAHAFVSVLHNLFQDDISSLSPDGGTAALLLMLGLAGLAVPFIVYGSSRHLLDIIEIPDKWRNWWQWAIRIYSALLLVLGLFFIVYRNGDDWERGLSLVLNEYFIYGSLYLIFPAIVATVYLRRSAGREKKGLLRQIMISFYPISVLAIVDIFFFRQSPYKVAYLSYFIFTLLAYFYISRRYVNRYESEEPTRPQAVTRFCDANDISEREREVIPLLTDGKSNREISETLFISTNTVKTHVRNIYRKTGASSRLQLLYMIRTHPSG